MSVDLNQTAERLQDEEGKVTAQLQGQYRATGTAKSYRNNTELQEEHRATGTMQSYRNSKKGTLEQCVMKESM